MKKHKFLIITAVILPVLLFPVRMNLKYGGSVRYKAVLYEVTKIHRLAETDGVKPYIDGYEIKILGTTVYRKTNERTIGKMYVYEKSAFSRIKHDKFVIIIHKDGTFTYSEGFAGSHSPTPENCTWKLTEDILILTEKLSSGKEYINYFKVDNDSLIFLEENSTNFMYTNVSDGDRFNATDDYYRYVQKDDK